MTKLDFLQIMGYLGAGISRDLPEKSMDVYFDLLGDLPAEVLFTAAKRVILEHKWATFPSIAELREAASQTLRGKVTEISPAEAWELGWRAAGRIDPEIDGSIERACQSLPPVIFETMKAFGINALCYGKEPVGVVRGQFMKIFEQLAAREKREALFPQGLTNSIRGALPMKVAEAITDIGRMEPLKGA
jgi:hypothetical protein